MTGPASRTGGSKKSPSVANRLKQHYIYRVIAPSVPGRALPLIGIWDRRRKSPLEFTLGYRETLHSGSGGGEGKKRGERFHHSLYMSEVFHGITKLRSKRNDPGSIIKRSRLDDPALRGRVNHHRPSSVHLLRITDRTVLRIPPH